MGKRNKVTRRRFLKGAAAAAGVMIVPRHVLAGGGGSPNEKLNVACIGCGGKGAGDVGSVAGEYVVALVDVDEKRAAGVFNKFPDAKKYKDFRRMLDELGDKIDAVTVSTPDHTHFVASMAAVGMGKHVFCQKPLTRTIWAARTLMEAARKHKVATQMGNQGHSGEGIRLLCEWIWAGAIGAVREVHYWTDRPIWPQGMNRPTDTPGLPASLDWDLWLGPAPERPYHPDYLPFKWRGWWDFGCGALGDIGCHSMDAAFWALRLGEARRVRVAAETSGANDETAPKWSIITYDFPARGEMPPVKLVWRDGKQMPPRPKDLEAGRDLPGGIGGQLFLGDKGTIMANTYCSSPRIIPESKMREFLQNRPAKTIPRSRGHVNDWILACKGGEPASSNFDYAGPLTEMVLLGNLAIRAGKAVEWDSEKMAVTNVPEANGYVRPYLRKGWEVLAQSGDSGAKPAPSGGSAGQEVTEGERLAQQAASGSAAEARARRLLSTARGALRQGQTSAARSFLKKIVSEYPGTEAAKEAERLLK